MSSLEEWKETSNHAQDSFAKLLSDRKWDEFKLPSENQQLWDKIAYSICGNPQSVEVGGGYTEHQKKLIDELHEKCITYSKKHYENAYVAFIFTCVWGKVNTTVPVIRIRKNEKDECIDSYFLDHTGRVYSDWNDYLNNNTWNECCICVPEHGHYDQDNQIKIYDQLQRGKFVDTLDRVTGVTNITSGVAVVGGVIMLFFPPTAAIGGILITAGTVIGVPGETYELGRNVGRLVDRNTHDQTINPFSSDEAREYWLITAATALSFGGIGSTKLLAKSAKTGHFISRTTRAICTALKVSNCAVHGLGVIHGFTELVHKDEVTPLDILQLTMNIFFFTHTLVTMKTAGELIKDDQMKRISQLKNELSKEHEHSFDSMLHSAHGSTEHGETGTMHGNAKFIKEMNIISNKQDFYTHFITDREDS